MKILIVSQHYYPEPFKITDIAEKLALRGHSVTVLCGIPNYPEGYYYRNYSVKENRVQTINGVKIIRAFEHPRKKGIVNRVLNYYSFSFFAKKLVKDLDDDFDVILANELSPIMMVEPAIKYKKKHKVKILMYEMDLWPESLLAGGIKKDSFVYSYYKKVSSKIYGQMDKILVSSLPHIGYIGKLTGDMSNIEWLPQYADDPIESFVRSFSSKKTSFLFAGNIGKAQNVKLILDAASLLKDDTGIEFTIVGSGSELDNLKQYEEKLKLNNVSFVGRVPLNGMGAFLKSADAGIVSLTNDSYSSMTIPGKVQTYMKAGLPIVACSGEATNSFVKTAKCGLVCNDFTPTSLAKIFKIYHNLDIQEKKKLSDNCLSYYESNLTMEKFINVLEENLILLSKGANSCD